MHGIILCFSNRNRINILTDLPLYLTYTYILKNQSHNLLKLHENMYVIATTNGHGKCNSLILCLINVIIHRHLIFLTLQYKFHELFFKKVCRSAFSNYYLFICIITALHTSFYSRTYNILYQSHKHII